jgi:hypothetical protein
MKLIKLSIFALLFSMFSATSNAQTADEVINKYITTIGGAEKLKALKGVKMEMTTNQGGMEIPVEVVQMPGGSTYVKINLQGKEITQMAFDGKTMWNTSFMTMKAEKSTAEESENMQLNNADFPDELFDYKTKGYKAEFVGKETKEGTECYKIKFTKKPSTIAGIKTDEVTFYYFETENNLVIATESEIKDGPMKGQKMTSTMSDYQEVDGIFFPFSRNMMGQPLKVKKVILNPVIDSKAFAFPAQ